MTEDRIDICGSGKSPELDIEISLNSNSQVMFLFGNKSVKQSIPEQIIVNNIISFDDIANIIDFILEDHQCIKDVNLLNNEFTLYFAINWNNESIKGINCGDIKLRLSFANAKIKKEYIYLIFQKYYSYLEQVPRLKEMRDDFINNIKLSYFNSLDKKGMLSLLNYMDENELRLLLNGLDNDTFIKYIIDVKEGKEGKQLLSQKSHK